MAVVSEATNCELEKLILVIFFLLSKIIFQGLCAAGASIHIITVQAALKALLATKNELESIQAK